MNRDDRHRAHHVEATLTFAYNAPAGTTAEPVLQRSQRRRPARGRWSPSSARAARGRRPSAIWSPASTIPTARQRSLLDGVDLRDITAESYRRLLGIVEQETFLFDGTIADNIAYGRRGATAEDIEQAARLANAHEFIARLDKGYDALIGERGVKLSGGQRQRLTIARAILADPRVLILDEATSNLDTESERLIQGSIQALMAGRTSFVIAHRLSTITHASRILVLENGRIIEQGRHEALLRSNGRYREMVDLQTGPPPAAKTKEADQAGQRSGAP